MPCPSSKRRRSHLLHRPRPCLALGCLVLLLHFFSSSSFSSTFLLPFLNSPPFFFMASFLKGFGAISLDVSLKGSWVLTLAVFLQRSSGRYPGCFCFLLLANLLSILPHGSSSSPILSFSLSLFTRGDRELSRARVPFLGVLGFPLPKAPTDSIRAFSRIHRANSGTLMPPIGRPLIIEVFFFFFETSTRMSGCQVKSEIF